MVEVFLLFDAVLAEHKYNVPLETEPRSYTLHQLRKPVSTKLVLILPGQNEKFIDPVLLLNHTSNSNFIQLIFCFCHKKIFL